MKASVAYFRNLRESLTLLPEERFDPSLALWMEEQLFEKRLEQAFAQSC